VVKDYSYLGHIITSDGKCEKRNKRKNRKCKKHIHQNKTHTSKQLSNKLKLNVINCYIYSTFLYIAET
jgi:predicted kinase